MTDITIALGVGLFAEDDDNGVETRQILGGWFSNQLGLTVGSACRLTNGFVDAGGADKVVIADIVTLPCQGPAAGLDSNVIGGSTGHQDSLVSVKREDVVLVLQ